MRSPFLLKRWPLAATKVVGGAGGRRARTQTHTMIEFVQVNCAFEKESEKRPACSIGFNMMNVIYDVSPRVNPCYHILWGAMESQQSESGHLTHHKRHLEPVPPPRSTTRIYTADVIYMVGHTIPSRQGACSLLT